MVYRSKVILITLALATSPAVVFAANTHNGNSLFQEKCAVCHGKDGHAVLPGAPNFAKGERMEKPDSTLKATITNGLNVMPPFKGALSDAQMGDLLAFIRTLRK